MSLKLCWVITDGRPGNENPALGLAEAIARRDPHTIISKHLEIRPAWRKILEHSVLRLLPGQILRTSGLAPPWPEMVIGCGSRSEAVCAAIRRLTRGGPAPALVLQLLKPSMAPGHFDLVIAPEHDGISGANILTSLGALSRVTDEVLDKARRRFPDPRDRPEEPTIAVLIGGSSRNRRMPADSMHELFDRLEHLYRRRPFRLKVTTSRRTGPELAALIAGRLANLPGEYWEGTGNNPYYAYLAQADAVIVTADSVNMVSDAAATGKPVYLHEAPKARGKLAMFHDALADRGITRPFTGELDHWTYAPLREAERIADQIIARKKNAGSQGPGKSNREVYVPKDEGAGRTGRVVSST